MKYIKYKNHSEYTKTELFDKLNPSSKLKYVNLSEENNSRDLLYNAPRFTVMRENNGNPQNVNDDKLIACFNVDTTKMKLLSDYDTLPSEEYYVIDNLYVLKNSGFNKQQDKMDNFFIKYPDHYPVGVKNFSEITDFVLEPYSEDDMGELATATSCKIHMNWTNRNNEDNGASDIDTYVYIFKKNANGDLEWLKQGDRETYYNNRTFENDEITVNLLWDDWPSDPGNNGKGEYIKIKQKSSCSDEEYAKYYFVYALSICTGSTNRKAVWDDVKISITNNMYIKTDYTIDTETNIPDKSWCGFIINNDNVLVQKNVFGNNIRTLINTEEFKNWNYIPTSSAPGSHLPGREQSIILPEINIDITEDVKSY